MADQKLDDTINNEIKEEFQRLGINYNGYEKYVKGPKCEIKGRLQEFTHKHYQCKPIYESVNRCTGKKIEYQVTVVFRNKRYESKFYDNKKQAGNEAAEKALIDLLAFHKTHDQNKTITGWNIFIDLESVHCFEWIDKTCEPHVYIFMTKQSDLRRQIANQKVKITELNYYGKDASDIAIISEVMRIRLIDPKNKYIIVTKDHYAKALIAYHKPKIDIKQAKDADELTGMLLNN